MTGRDRIVVMIVGALLLLGASWVMLVSPERKKASQAQSEVNSASAQVTSAEGQLANARAAQKRYASAYASIVRLGKAVPASREVPSLVYDLARTTSAKHVDFTSITAGAGSGASASSSASGATASTVGGFTQMPFTFVFNGSFNDLYNLFRALDGFTYRTSSGGLRVKGRLLTIQSAKLSPLASGQGTGAKQAQELTGTITATAYVLPASQGLTAGATVAGPSGSISAAATGAGSGPAPAAPAATALAGVHP